MGKDGQSYWSCRCDCGKEVVVMRGSLKHGTKSCGCKKQENLNQLKDLANMRFGRLTALYYEVRGKRIYWLCKCDCGTEKWVRSDCLTRGGSTSCGCYNAEKTRRQIKHGDGRRGKSSRIYNILITMKQRCENPRNPNYKYYGGRGISICPEWHDYMTFKKWALSNGYNDTLTIDRIDVNGNYEPSNCRWVTMKVQANNTRGNHYISLEGVTKTRTQWAELFGILPTSLDNYKWKHKCSYEEAVKHYVEQRQSVAETQSWK